MYTLYIGNKNYSSWSLRGWLVDEALRRAVRGGAGRRSTGTAAIRPNPRVLAVGPACRACTTATTVVWDSLAIAEYLAERHPGMWPADAVARAWARSICAEMHSGFSALRNEMTMCIRERVDVRPWSPALARDIARVDEIWNESRRRFGSGGPYPLRRVLARRRVLRAGGVSLPDLRRRAGRRGGRLPARAARASVAARMGSARRSRRRRSSTRTSRASSIATSSRRRGRRRDRWPDAALAALAATRSARAAAARTPLRIRGGGTKDFYGEALAGDVLDIARLRRHRRLRSDRARHHRARRHAARRDRGGDGARAARCSRSSRRISAPAATLGGAVAAGLSGTAPALRGRGARPRARRARCSTARGDDLAFGGRVMKNVAGFDVSRLMTGALGTLGVLTEVSLKCLPLPKAEATRVFECSADEAIRLRQRMGRQAAAALGDLPSTTGRLAVRLSGAAPAVDAATRADRRRRASPTATRSGARCATTRIAFFARRASGARRCGGCRSRLDGAVRGPRRRAADRMGRRIALARRRRSAPIPRSVRAWARDERRPCNAVSRGRQVGRRVPSAAARRCSRCIGG